MALNYQQIIIIIDSKTATFDQQAYFLSVIKGNNHDLLNSVSKKRTGFRAWFYLRMGYSVYWAFLFMGINTLTVTYYLAIERAPFLKEVFPSFLHYAIFLIIIAIPILVLTGFIHFKKLPGYKSEAEVSVESNPYTYKVPPGWMKHVFVPYYLVTTKYLVKIANNEKLNEDDIKEITVLQKKMESLIKGEYVGIEGRILSFGDDKKES